MLYLLIIKNKIHFYYVDNVVLKQFLSLSFSRFPSFSLSIFYYKEVNCNRHRTLFNRSWINDDKTTTTTTTTTKLQHLFKYRRRVCRESRHLSASFVRSLARSLARTCSICSNNRWRQDFLRSVSGDLGQSDRRYTNRTIIRYWPYLFPSDFLMSSFAADGLVRGTIASRPEMSQSRYCTGRS